MSILAHFSTLKSSVFSFLPGSHNMLLTLYTTLLFALLLSSVWGQTDASGKSNTISLEPLIISEWGAERNRQLGKAFLGHLNEVWHIERIASKTKYDALLRRLALKMADGEGEIHSLKAADNVTILSVFADRHDWYAVCRQVNLFEGQVMGLGRTGGQIRRQGQLRQGLKTAVKLKSYNGNRPEVLGVELLHYNGDPARERGVVLSDIVLSEGSRYFGGVEIVRRREVIFEREMSLSGLVEDRGLGEGNLYREPSLSVHGESFFHKGGSFITLSLNRSNREFYWLERERKDDRQVAAIEEAAQQLFNDYLVLGELNLSLDLAEGGRVAKFWLAGRRPVGMYQGESKHLRLPAAQYDLVVRSEGYPVYRAGINIEKGQLTRHVVEMKRSRGKLRLEVGADKGQPSVNLTLVSKELGASESLRVKALPRSLSLSKGRALQGLKAPAQPTVTLLAGPWTVKAQASGYEVWQGPVEVVAGQEVRVEVVMKKEYEPEKVAEVSTPPVVKPKRKPSKQPVVVGDSAGSRQVLSIAGVEVALRWCPPGSFMMGSPRGEGGRGSDETQHWVTLTRGFWLMETEVTQELWEAVMGNNPSRFKGAQRPVENVSWHDGVAFCKKLSKLTGREWNLPTEAEWEYACRAGTQTAYSFGDDAGKLGDYAWYDGNSGSKTHPVGQKLANAWGLFDMHGNVWEWCADWYDQYSVGNAVDPTGPAASRSYRVERGGDWITYAWDCRCADRSLDTPVLESNILGLRVLCR